MNPEDIRLSDTSQTHMDSVRFPLCEVPSIVEFTQTASRMEFARV